jgi:hypothetical protein
MSEDFSAWEEKGTSWCRISEWGNEPETAKFEWCDNDTGDQCEPPRNAWYVQRILHACAVAFYNAQGAGSGVKPPA